MELLVEIEKRRAKRALSEKKIPADVVDRIMTAATYAPSCFNNQPYRFLVVDQDKELEKIRLNMPDANYWAKKSPLMVLVTTKPELDCQLDDKRDYAFFDVGLAVENMILQAVKEGLVAHPIAGYRPVSIKKAFGIPDDYTLIVIVVIAYPGDESILNSKHLTSEHSERNRKPKEEVVFFNTFRVV